MGAENIGAEKRRSILNAAVDMGLCGKMDHGVKVSAEKFGNGSPVGDVASNERVPLVLCDVGQILRVACVGQLVEIEDFDVAAGVQEKANEISADKAYTARDQNSQSPPSFLTIRTLAAIRLLAPVILNLRRVEVVSLARAAYWCPFPRQDSSPAEGIRKFLRRSTSPPGCYE